MDAGANGGVMARPLEKSISVSIEYAKSVVISIVSMVDFRPINGLGFAPKVSLVGILTLMISISGY